MKCGEVMEDVFYVDLKVVLKRINDLSSIL